MDGRQPTFVNIPLNGQSVGFYNAHLDRCLNAVMAADDPITIYQRSAEFVANMEDLLDLYAEPYDPRRPVVCFDETSTQLLAETRPSLPPRPGIPLRQDYEYRREGGGSTRGCASPATGRLAIPPSRRQ